ncbi:MAG: hypothetical protein HON94_08130 [Methylococcales bacterium]|jgi:hypothetical protein|nr:hypothetical protein [Methylococcales bacterium]
MFRVKLIHGLVTFCTLLMVVNVQADDIDAFKSKLNEPVVMIEFDSSGSMNWCPDKEYKYVNRYNLRGSVKKTFDIHRSGRVNRNSFKKEIQQRNFYVRGVGVREPRHTVYSFIDRYRNKYISYYVSERNCNKSRLEIAKQAVIGLLNKNPRVRYGMQTFDEKIFNVEPLNHRKNIFKERLPNEYKKFVNLQADGGTPLCKVYRDNIAPYMKKVKQSFCSSGNVIMFTDGVNTSSYAPNSVCEKVAVDLFKNHNIKTYPIGLGLTTDSQFLQSVANYGQLTAEDRKNKVKSIYQQASGQDLGEAFQKILDSITSRSMSMTSATLTNKDNSIYEHSSEVFVSGFATSEHLKWKGNVKRYTMGSNGRLQGAIYDENKMLLGMMSGGFGEVLQKKVLTSDRRILTNVGHQLLQIKNPIAAKQLGLDLKRDQNLIKWVVRGIKPGSKKRDWLIGDILHSKPEVINYCSGKKTCDKRAIGMKRVVFGTNHGFLHLFDKNGHEKWAFYPNELGRKDGRKSLMETLYLNNKKEGVKGMAYHPYGVDGKLAIYKLDNNNDGDYLDANEGDKVYLYFGMREGGQSYYGIDLTNPDKPKMLWNHRVSLGHSWSVPTITKILNSRGKEQLVVIVGGGYSDNRFVNNVKGRTNAIYVLDAISGKKVFSFTHGAMKDVVARVNVMDSNFDGATDRLYVGDLGGNLWRVDLSSSKESKTFRLHNSLTLLANLNKKPIFVKTNVIRTYDAKNYLNEQKKRVFERTKKRVDLIIVGTGERHKIDKEDSNNKIVLIRDYNIGVSKTSLKTLKISSKDEFSLEKNARMWNPPYTYDGVTYISIYVPPTVTRTNCGNNASFGYSKKMAFDLFNWMSEKWRYDTATKLIKMTKKIAGQESAKQPYIRFVQQGNTKKQVFMFTADAGNPEPIKLIGKCYGQSRSCLKNKSLPNDAIYEYKKPKASTKK